MQEALEQATTKCLDFMRRYLRVVFYVENTLILKIWIGDSFNHFVSIR